MTANGYEISFVDDECVLKSGMIFPQLEFAKNTLKGEFHGM